METTWIAALIGIGSVVGVLIYWFGAIFTRGVKLWPRERDAKGWIKPHPFHKIEALVWPVSWPINWFLRLVFFGFRGLGKVLSFLTEKIYHLGEQAGRDPLPVDGGNLQRRV